MALDSGALSSAIKSELASNGFVASEKNNALADAIAKAVVEHITSNAQVVVDGGSSAGTYTVT